MTLTCPKCGHGFDGGRLARRTDDGYVHRSCPRLCSIEGCGKHRLARGWCRSHYDSWRYKGDPMARRVPLSDEQIEDIEWMAETGETWTGALTRLGVKSDALEQFLARRDRRDLVRWLMRTERGVAA